VENALCTVYLLRGAPGKGANKTQSAVDMMKHDTPQRDLIICVSVRHASYATLSGAT